MSASEIMYDYPMKCQFKCSKDCPCAAGAADPPEVLDVGVLKPEFGEAQIEKMSSLSVEEDWCCTLRPSCY